MSLKLVTAGRLVPQKGYDRLIDVVGRLVKDGFIFELWILGEGTFEDTEKLKDQARNCGASDYIKFLGFQDNPYKYMTQCDLFVCSSRSEGYSTVVTEALILGIPVVSTRCAGTDELLGTCVFDHANEDGHFEENEYGVITDNDSSSLYLGLKFLLSNPEKLNHYNVLAKKRGEEFTLESLMAPIEKLLLE